MTPEEKGLLLTVARLLRAHMSDHINHPDFSDIDMDWQDLSEALAPFGPSDAPPVNEVAIVPSKGTT